MTRFALHLALAAVSAFAVNAQTFPDLDLYYDLIEDLGRNGYEIAMSEGRDALIAQYESILAQFPDYPKNIQIQAQIGTIYEWDLSANGEPPDLAQALDAYLGVINTYDPDSSYMKEVKRLAANRAVDVDPDIAEQLYLDLMSRYPDDEAIQVEGAYGLGKIAENRGDTDAADDFYDQALTYPLGLGAPGDATSARAEQAQEAAAANMLAKAVREAKTPADRLRALEDMVERYPVMRERLGDLVDRYRTAIEDQNAELDTDAMEEALQNLMNALSETPEPADLALAPVPNSTIPEPSEEPTDSNVSPPSPDPVAPPATDAGPSALGNGGYVLILLIVTLTLVMAGFAILRKRIG